MSLRIINNLINFICDNLNVLEDDIIIKKINIDNDNFYSIELKIDDKLYSIRHFEPLEIVQGINYGMGHCYDCSLFDKVKGHFVDIKF